MSDSAQTINNDTNGGILNSLGILTEDRMGFYPDAFFKYSPYNRTVLAKEAKVSRTNLYKETVKLSTIKQLKKGILQVVMGTDLAIELFKDNTEEAIKWFNAPNTMLSGESPFEVCIRGDGHGLLNWLKGRLGYSDAVPF